jgi:hypothetical protein
MLPLGLGFVVLGLVWVVWMHVTAAWPSVLPWMVVATGGILTCVALQRRGYRGAWALWLLLGGATAALLLGWLLG